MALNSLPNAGQTLGNSRAQIKANFDNINNNFLVNHVELNSGGDSGKHKYLQFPTQAAAPATNATEIGLYGKSGPKTGIPELFFRRTSSGVEREMTASILSTNPAVTGLVDGWTYLPSGILIKWGTTGAAGLNPTIIFPVAANIPAFATQPFTVQITATSSTRIWVAVIATLSFTAQMTTNAGFTWIAIGR